MIICYCIYGHILLYLCLQHHAGTYTYDHIPLYLCLQHKAGTYTYDYILLQRCQHCAACLQHSAGTYTYDHILLYLWCYMVCFSKPDRVYGRSALDSQL